MVAIREVPIALRNLRWSNGTDYEPADIPLPGRIVGIVLSLVTLCVIAACLTRRVQKVRRWRTLPLANWEIIIIYVDSFLFVFCTAVFRDVGLNESINMCRGAILLCLTFYLTTKVVICAFLVEKAYIVRGTVAPRYKDKLYIFNFCITMGPYAVLGVLNIVWRFSFIDDTGTCVIGMEKRALLPLIVVDALVNIYLTTLFIMPLRQLYSYKSHANTVLHTMAVRTFVGSCLTLASAITNLTLLMALNGEKGWACFLSCNAEVLFSVLTLHWVTSRDRTGQTTDRSYSTGALGGGGGGGVNTVGSGHISKSRSKSGNKSKIGTETLISEHYHAASAGNGMSGWPDDMKATINASCEAGGGRGDDIALNRIIVTQDHTTTITSGTTHTVTVGERSGRRSGSNVGVGGSTMGIGVLPEVESDGRSETTASTSRHHQRDGSTDGIVNA